MSTHDYKFEYHRNLPHFQPQGRIFFITFRLHGSIPQAYLKEWHEQKELESKQLDQIKGQDERESIKYTNWKRQFGRFDDFLNQAKYGPTWLAKPEIAKIVSDAIHYYDGQKYRLDAFCIMSNHVHIVQEPLEIEPNEFHSLASIIHSVKSFTSNKCNQFLDQTGAKFWQAENYDHVIRNEGEWHRIMNYVLMNPVKAGLVNDWRNWPWTYCKYM